MTDCLFIWSGKVLAGCCRLLGPTSCSQHLSLRHLPAFSKCPPTFHVNPRGKKVRPLPKAVPMENVPSHLCRIYEPIYADVVQLWPNRSNVLLRHWCTLTTNLITCMTMSHNQLILRRYFKIIVLRGRARRSFNFPIVLHAASSVILVKEGQSLL